MKLSTMAYAQPLRAVTLLSTIICFPFAIASTILSLEEENRGWYRSRRPATALCFTYFGLAATTALSVASFVKLRRTGKALGPHTAYFDLFAATLYLSVIIPILVRELSEFGSYTAGIVVVVYTTVPMFTNMFLHTYVFLCYAIKFLLPCSKPRKAAYCPNCQGTIRPDGPQEIRQATKGEGYSLLRGEEYLDEDAVHYTDARESEDLLQARASEDVQGAEEGESSDKGKIVLDV